MMRSVDVTLATNTKESLVYANFAGFIIVGFVRVESPRKWKGTKIHVRSGHVGDGALTLPATFRDFIYRRCDMVQEIHQNISKEQRTRIKAALTGDSERVLKSHSLRALHEDVHVFGKEKVFRL